MEIRNITVIGAGQMGRGIAQTFAQNGFDVALYDIDGAAASGINAIQASLSRLADKGEITEEQSTITMEAITPSTDLDCAKNSELVIEAVPENMELKKSLFKDLDLRCNSNAILASNTSSLSITEIEECCACAWENGSGIEGFSRLRGQSHTHADDK